MEKYTIKKVLTIIGVSFGVFLAVAVLIYVNIDNILNLFDPMEGNKKDSDGHMSELIISTRDLERINEFGNSIEEMVEQGVVGDNNIIPEGETNEENVFTSQIQDLENRVSSTPDLTSDEELNIATLNTIEDIIDISDFPDSPFDFNPR